MHLIFYALARVNIDACPVLLTLFSSSAEQAGDGRGSAQPHAVCGVPGLSARAHRPPAAAVRGRGQPGRETHEEEELQVGLTTACMSQISLGRFESCGWVNMQHDSFGKTAI